jgi:hypothetical protein
LFFLGKKTGYQPFSTLFLGVSVGLLILSRNSSKWLNYDLLVILGLISYPLYLWHYPLIAFSNIFGLKLFYTPFIQLFLSILLGWCTYWFIEIRTRKITNPSKISALIVLVIGVGVTGEYIEKAEGLPTRPHIMSSIAKLAQLKRESAKNVDCGNIIKTAGVVKPAFEYCRSSTTRFEAKFVAVIGDSHAHVMYSGFSESLKKNNYETLLLANSGSPGFLDGAMGKNIEALKKSEIMIGQIFDVLDRLPNLEKVIIVSRGPIYFEEIGFGAIEKKYNQKALKFGSYFIDPEHYNPEMDYFAGLERTINHLLARKTGVYLLLENPELGFSPQTCVDRPYNIIPHYPCKIPNKTFRDRMEKYRYKIQALKKKIPRLQLLDPAQLLCDKNWCYAKKNGELLYADDDHLSVYGSRYVAQQFNDQIIN